MITKYMKIIFFFLFLSIAPPTQLLAMSNDGIRCVQSQLNAAEFDAGSVDGQIGQRTRSALSEYQKKYGTITDKPINSSTAIVFCRGIGLVNPELKKFWPSDVRWINVVYSESIDQEFRSDFQRSLKRALDAYSSTIGVEVAGTDTIVIAENESDLRKLIRKHSHSNIPKNNPYIRARCNSPNKITGRTHRGIIYLCRTRGAQIGGEISQAWLDYLVSHELIHLAQYQLAGRSKKWRGQDEELRSFGPIWFAEGIAEAFSNRLGWGSEIWELRELNYRRLQMQLPDLSQLEKRQALQKGQLIYNAGAIAVVDLLDLTGFKTAMKMYELLGKGEKWPGVFKSAFGMSHRDFYKWYLTVERFEVDGRAIRKLALQ